MSTLKTIVTAIMGSIFLTLLVFAGSLLPSGDRAVQRLTTIQGIPYPQLAGATHIDEPLAHADIFIDQPVFTEQLELKIQYLPTHITSLAVGVRENSFWLSYTPQNLSVSSTNKQPLTSTVTIPLTDKLQEADQSIDLMFFAEGEQPEWELVSLTARVVHTWPTWPEFKDYARAIVYRERAL